MTIKSKIHKYGNEHESSWPSDFGTGEKGTFHIDKVTGKAVEGYPVSENLNFGTAPIVIFDSMPPTYHEKECRIVESRKEWEALDKAHGCITFGSPSEAKPKVDAANEEKKQKAELRKASKTALEVYRANPKEVEQRLQKQAEQQIKTLKKSGMTKQLNETIKDKTWMN